MGPLTVVEPRGLGLGSELGEWVFDETHESAQGRGQVSRCRAKVQIWV